MCWQFGVEGGEAAQWEVARLLDEWDIEIIVDTSLVTWKGALRIRHNSQPKAR